ncbi:MAG: hypothetical protein IJR97_03050 [Clostridia bacterium]|nr:hypothetical protein [Clostridia bacterium]
MRTKQAENIRSFRRERSLPQERLLPSAGGDVRRSLQMGGEAVGAGSDRVEEAEEFLSEALLKAVSDLITTIMGYMNVYLVRVDRASCQAVLGWGIGLRKADRPNCFDRVSAALLADLAGSQFLAGQAGEARDTLIKARDLAAFFDASPSYDESDIRYVIRIEGASAHDDLGATAMNGVDHAVSQFDHEEFTALWRSVIKQEACHE